ncbi:hypothetical protein [Halobacillus campisalis]|uniref:hypothetical protein n=1 Tax=Halobacillus campisalis TaxID=435909 RepID=UPI0036F1EE2E
MKLSKQQVNLFLQKRKHINSFVYQLLVSALKELLNSQLQDFPLFRHHNERKVVVGIGSRFSR